MKQTLLALILLAFAASSLAQNAAPAAPATTPSRFELHKAKVVTRIQARIARQQALLACMQAAQDRAAMKACRPQKSAAQ